VSKVVPIGCITRLDLQPDRVLEMAAGKMEGVVVMGYDRAGELYFASTYADGGTVLWLLEQCKKRLLEVADEVAS
jgi:hypothetical protein